MEMRALVGALVLFLGACSQSPRESGTSRFAPFARAKLNRLVVVSAEEVGKLYVLNLDEGTVSSPEEAISTDAFARAPFGSANIYVLNRQEGSNVTLFEKKSLRQLKQTSVDVEYQQTRDPKQRHTNPQDIAILSENDVYVSRQDAGLLRMDPLVGRGSHVIDLSWAADRSPQSPVEMSFMNLMGTRLVIALQRLDRSNPRHWKPSDSSWLAVVDAPTGRVVSRKRLLGKNPLSDFKTDPENDLYLSEPGDTTDPKSPGLIERFDSRTLDSKGAVFQGKALDFEMVSTELGVALVTNPDFSTSLVAFDPRTRQSTKVLKTSSAKGPLAGMALDRERGLLFVGDRNPQAPGIDVYRTTDLGQVTHVALAGPWYLTLTD